MTDETSPYAAAAKGLCPRCGAKTMFQGLAAFAPACRACGLDFAAFNVGDGPAAFLTLIVGALITALALGIELGVGLPLWIHVILWFPITIIAVIFSLRFAKGLLLALEYRNKAREGRIADE
ncbi:DUF983 domain-containing protein [Allosphingosinicella vermicomposti]|uniref:DUF983 domain-containing protein n=1 Tax=Allosphingosinicella vermicomposti TaxID=614671 RepID=UPI000D0E63BA|nr:DUF983 domain-containing protein [Allosphingosinicella vermicomposti]